ncbi:MAG: LytR/AlgR family response regulator transcription factor [Candidatus Cyclobacteriaceae bacterium M2_1C_046]
MDKIKVLIVEDELLTAEHIKDTLLGHNFEITDIVDSGEKALRSLEDSPPDLVLMDIKLAGLLDGITTTEKLRAQVNIPVVYLSDLDDQETFDRSKETGPAHFLSKPFRKKDLIRALELAYSNAAKQNHLQRDSKLNDRIFIQTELQSSVMIPYAEILFLKAERSYCAVVTTKKKYLTINNMKTVFDRFEDDNFIKVHRSHIVNIKHISGMTGNMLRVGEHNIQISKNFKDDVRKIINLIK